MLTSTATAASTSATGTSTAGNQKSRTDLGQKDIFLKLLVAQMKFQDPQKPQDPTQMASQLAQFNMVEQQTNTNNLLTKLLANGGTAGASGSTATATWLGHSVTVKQNQVHFSGTAQNFTIDLPSAAATGFLTISDASGQPVRTVQLGNMPAGANQFVWNGLMDNGSTAPAGNYTINVSATDLQGQSVTPTILRNGVVDAVRFNAKGNELVVGGIATTTADITEIRP